MGNFKLLLISVRQFLIWSKIVWNVWELHSWTRSLKWLSDNNINSNNFMLAAPGGRDFPPSDSQTGRPSLLELVVAGNEASLERLRRLLERQPDCGTIVKCDLASLALSYQPALSRWDPGTMLTPSSLLFLIIQLDAITAFGRLPKRIILLIIAIIFETSDWLRLTH